MKRLFRRWRHWLVLVAALAALAGYIAFTLEREYRSTVALETERLSAQSKVVEDNLRRQLAAINLTIERIVTELPRWQRRADGRNEGLQYLKSLSTGMSSVRTFAVVDAQGTITLSNREELMGRNFAQRDYFQAPLRSLNPKTLYVSAPFKTVLGVYTITLTRAVLDGKGNFAGVVSAILDPLDMQILLNSVRYADDMQVMLVHGDGKVLVMESESSAVLGKDLSQPGSPLSQHLKSGHTLSHFKETADGTRN
ncbi:MAG: cache domain-containing protein, partial [Rhodoferax sp.]|nr:cache domain-containing protein [Rhodoferax sp.]